MSRHDQHTVACEWTTSEQLALRAILTVRSPIDRVVFNAVTVAPNVATTLAKTLCRTIMFEFQGHRDDVDAGSNGDPLRTRPRRLVRCLSNVTVGKPGMLPFAP